MEAIFRYIQARNSPPAFKWFLGLKEAIETLAHYPLRNPVIPEDPTLRHLLYGRKPHIYRIIYSVDPSGHRVDIVHVRHHARDSYIPTG
jgi:plasmid stabilization system protein ParE